MAPLHGAVVSTGHVNGIDNGVGGHALVAQVAQRVCILERIVHLAKGIAHLVVLQESPSCASDTNQSLTLIFDSIIKSHTARITMSMQSKLAGSSWWAKVVLTTAGLRNSMPRMLS